MIPLIIMGGILTGWFTPTEAGMVAVVYILVVVVPLLAPGHLRHLPRDFVYTGLLYLPLALIATASAFGWLLAYLRGPDIVIGLAQLFAGHDGRLIMLLLVLLFIVIGDFMDAVPAIIIFMPIVMKLNELGNINPLHMGVVLITTLVFGLITPPYGLSLLVASKFVGVAFTRAMLASLPIYVVFLVTIAFTVLFPDVVLYLPKLLLPESVGCFKNPSGPGYICQMIGSTALASQNRSADPGGALGRSRAAICDQELGGRAGRRQRELHPAARQPRRAAGSLRLRQIDDAQARGRPRGRDFRLRADRRGGCHQSFARQA